MARAHFLFEPIIRARGQSQQGLGYDITFEKERKFCLPHPRLEPTNITSTQFYSSRRQQSWALLSYQRNVSEKSSRTQRLRVPWGPPGGQLAISVTRTCPRVLEVSRKGLPQLTDIYTCCRVSPAPLRSGLGSSGLAAAIPPITLNENCAHGLPHVTSATPQRLGAQRAV